MLLIQSTNLGSVNLLAYVDENMVTENNMATIENIINQLNSKVNLKDLGALNYFLSMEV